MVGKKMRSGLGLFLKKLWLLISEKKRARHENMLRVKSEVQEIQNDGDASMWEKETCICCQKGTRIRDENQLIEIKGRERRRKFGYEVQTDWRSGK